MIAGQKWSIPINGLCFQNNNIINLNSPTMEQTNEEQWDWYVSSVSLELRNAINDALKTLSELKIDTESAALIKRAIQRIQDDYEKIKSNDFGKKVVNIFINHYHAPGSMNVQEFKSVHLDNAQ